MALHLVAISVGHAANGGSLRAYIGTYAALVHGMNGTQHKGGSMRTLVIRKETAGYSVRFSDTGHIYDWADTKVQARAIIAGYNKRAGNY